LIQSVSLSRRLARVALLVTAMLLTPAATASAATLPTGFETQTVITGLTAATGIAYAPDGRAFVIEKAGRLKVAQPGATTATQLLDVSNHVNDFGDRGLLGIAVDASFATNGYVFLLYTYDVSPLTPDSSSAMVSRLVRVKVNPDSTLDNPGAPETVLIGSYTSGPCPQAANTLDCIPSNGTSHSIGSVRVASDGTLYVGSGDSADFNIADPLSFRTYDEQSYAGKILHVDRDGQGLPGHAFCAADTDLTHVCTKLHAKGFRNPFRFTIRPNGGLAVGDVGWNTTEEVDLIDTSGGNYGWPCYEATDHTPGYSSDARCTAEYAKEGDPATADRYPAYHYDRSLGSAVVGGPTYTGDQYPEGYRDSIFIGDYTSNTLRRIVLDDQGQVASVQGFATDWIGTALELDPTSGDLVSVNYGTGAPGDGFVERYAYTTGNHSPVAQLAATPTEGNAPLTVDFSAAGSTDQDADELHYSWDFGDGDSATGISAQHVYTEPIPRTATLTVDDGRGRSATKTVQITPGGNAPEVTIEAPAAGFLSRDGETVQLHASAQDAEDGTLASSSFHWLVRLNHNNTHFHPIADLTGAQTSFQAVTDHDADSFYVITVTATDSSGLDDSKTFEIHPQTTDLQIESEPPGAPLSYGGRAGSAPWALLTTIGYETTVTADERFSANGRTYVFDHWSDGGAASHEIAVPDGPSTLRATYLQELTPGVSASASSVEGPAYEAGAAVDGDPLTRWGSLFADDQWWQVDLGSTQLVSRAEVDWETAYAPSYEIRTSLDGAVFETAATDAATAAGTEITSFAPRSARYVRIQALARANPDWGVSAFEVRFFGPLEDPPVTPPTDPRTVPPPDPDTSTGSKPGDTAVPTDTTRPGISRLHVTYAKRKKGAPASRQPVFALRLTETATIELTLTRRAHGRWRRVTTLRRQVKRGSVRVGLPRTLALKAGRYRVSIVAADRAGNRSQRAASLHFRIPATPGR
jgi:glucose/arabinose dehydrogenase/PKD repeat protein